MITPAFPPYQGSQTQRMLSISNGLIAAGIDVFVLTTEIMQGHPSYNENTIKLVDPKIKIFRCNAGILHRKAYKKYTDCSMKKYGRTTEKASKKQLISYKIYQILDRLKTFFLIPDTMIDWYFSTIRFIKKQKVFEGIKPDLILSCAMPNTCHIISFHLSKKYGIPMIMDYGDPWVYIATYNHGKIRFAFEKFIENRILLHALFISFSTGGAERLYQEKFKLSPNKTMTVMTGFETQLLEKTKVYKTMKHDGIVLTYGGAIQTGIRDPSIFLKAFDNFTECIMYFNMRTDNVPKLKALVNQNITNNRVTVDSYLPFNQYYEEMLNSDILVFFGNSTTDQLPGKIFNYLPTGKLIFYISNVPYGGKDQAIDIVKDYGYYILVQNEYEEIMKGLKMAVKKVKNYGSINYKKIEKYSTYNQMRLLANRIKELDRLIKCDEK